MSTASTLRLLIVDEHAENRQVARWMIERAFEKPIVFEAGSLADAEAFCDAEQLDVIILDAATSDFPTVCSVLAQRAEDSFYGLVLIVGATELTQRAFGEELGLEHWVVKELLSAYTLELVVRRAVDHAGARLRLAELARQIERLQADRESAAVEVADLQNKLVQAASVTVATATVLPPVEPVAVVPDVPVVATPPVAVAMAANTSVAVQMSDSEDDRPKLITRQVNVALLEGSAVGRQLQSELAPPGSPLIEGFEIAGLSLPAEATGGDYYDYLPCGDGLLCITIGECSGRGLAPTMLATSLRAYLRVLTASMTDPSDIVSQANRLITEDIGDEEFLVTMMLVQIDQITKRIRYSSAGHQGYHLDRDGQAKVLQSTGMPMGLGGETVIPEGTPLRLKAGELLLLITDGMQKMMSDDGTQYGVERMLNVVRQHRHLSPRMIVSELKKAAMQFSKVTGQGDDITAVIVRAEGGNGHHF